jgi:2-polyprenyl-3-methyl-5-hydroxy-6-metoxy-1,4-benzoquinol methylase
MNLSPLNLWYRYKNISLCMRIYLILRWITTPYYSMTEHLPSNGKILDLGCGYGLLTLALAQNSSNRCVLGFDIDNNRIQAAQKSTEDIKNIRFLIADLTSLPCEQFNGIALIDVMQYFPISQQFLIFRQMYAALETGGIMIVRGLDPNKKSLAASINIFYEKMAVLIGFTKSIHKKTYFATPSEWTEELSRIGFSVKSLPCTSYYFDDILYVCKKLESTNRP